MNKTLTPHKHAAIIREWAEHLASGAVAAGWYEVQAKFPDFPSGSWLVRSVNDRDFNRTDYRIVMTEKHPDYLPPKKKIALEFEFTDEEIGQMAENLRYHGFLTTADFSLLSTALLNALEKSV